MSVEEQAPNDSTPQALPESSPQPPPEQPAAPKSPKSRLLAGAAIAVALVVGLYYLNRYWISPAVRAQTKGDQNHPMAPQFSLTDIDGKQLKLSDYLGKVVIVDFWATWCGPCQIEIPGFVDLQKRYASQGFTMIGISMDDSAEPVVDFYKKFQMDYPVAVGNDRLGELYGGVEGLPTTFVIGRDGRIYAKHVGAYDLAIFEQEVKQLLAAGPADEDRSFRQAGAVFTDDKVQLGNPAVIDSEVPGIDLTKLTAAQKEAYKKTLASLQCTCGCNMSILRCRQVDRNCAISRKVAEDQYAALLKTPNGSAAAK